MSAGTWPSSRRISEIEMALVEVNWKPDSGQLRTFGLVGSAAFCTLAVVWMWNRVAGESSAVGPAVVWAVISAWTLVAIATPGLLRPVYVVVTAVGLPIGIVVSFAILAAVYFVIFTPISLVFRLMGRDALKRRFDPDAETYWAPHRPAGDVRRYFRQF